MAKKSMRNDLEVNHAAEIGERLKQLRINYGKSQGKNINQEEFGKILGLEVSEGSSMQGLVGKLERGDTLISPAELIKYSSVCGVSIDYIVTGTIDAERKPNMTLRDFCDAIVKLDKCGMLHVLKREDDLLISFNSRPFVEESYSNWGQLEAPAHYEEIDGEFSRWGTDSYTDGKSKYQSPFGDLQTFMSNYVPVKRLANADTFPDHDSLAELALEKSLDKVSAYPIEDLLRDATKQYNDDLAELIATFNSPAKSNAESDNTASDTSSLIIDDELPFN